MAHPWRLFTAYLYYVLYASLTGDIGQNEKGRVQALFSSYRHEIWRDGRMGELRNFAYTDF